MGGLRLALVGVILTATAGGIVLAVLLLHDGGGGESVPTRHELAYFEEDGSLWIYDADNDARRKLADDATCGTHSRLEWSPTGERLACIGYDPGVAFPPGRIVLRDTNGAVVGRIEEDGVQDFYWSPSGDVFLYGVALFVEPPSIGARRYRIADSAGREIADLGAWDLTGVVWPAWASYGLPLWTPQGGDLIYRPSSDAPSHVYSLVLGDRETGTSDYPLAWAVNGGERIVARDYQPPSSEGASPKYEAMLTCRHCPPSGVGRRLTALDNGVQFWVAPGGEHAVYLRSHRADGPGLSVLAVTGLAVLDLRTGEAKPIPNSLITYGSDGIPKEWVTFSPDGQYVYWVGGDGAGYRARIDGTGLERVVEIDSFAFDWSPDHEKIAYSRLDPDAGSVSLIVADGNGSEPTVVKRIEASSGTVQFPIQAFWRPQP